MNFSEQLNTDNKKNAKFNTAFFLLFCGSLIVLIATFLITNSSFDFVTKLVIFGGIIALYLIFGIAIHLFHNYGIVSRSNEIETAQINNEEFFTPEIKEKLLVFEEAQSFFSASLKPADMFRLISSRIEELIPFTTCAMFLADQKQTKLKIVQATGENAAELLDREINFDEGLAGKTFAQGEIQIDEKLLFERNLSRKGVFDKIKTAIAAPLKREMTDVFGVLVLYGENEKAYGETEVRLLKEISRRISPLLANSLNYVRNLENSLKDPLTDLPNERAFYLVLENQVAESVRLREQRPLTVLSIDIKNFEELNKKFGHATGDKILNLTAKIIKSQLRQMDFLSRVSADEFLAILPTASTEVAQIITERIEKAFSLNMFPIAENDQIYVQLNFGLAAFITDGETPQELVKQAILKKQEAKSGLNGSVIFFPREYVN